MLLPRMEVSVGDDGAELDFTELLDELLAASAEAGEGGDDDVAAPSLRVDLLSQIERLRTHSGPLFADRAMHEYREAAAEAAQPTPRQAKSGHAKPEQAKSAQPKTAPDLQPALDDLFFLDPQSILRELGIGDRSRPEELDRARRAFAMRYHPDRMPEEMRGRAALRMQIANMLIDEAKRRKR